MYAYLKTTQMGLSEKLYYFEAPIYRAIFKPVDTKTEDAPHFDSLKLNLEASDSFNTHEFTELIQKNILPSFVIREKSARVYPKIIPCRRRNNKIPHTLTFSKNKTSIKTPDVAPADDYWYYTYTGFEKIFGEETQDSIFYQMYEDAPQTQFIFNGKNILKALIDVFGRTIHAGRILVCYYFLSQKSLPTEEYGEYYMKFTELVVNGTPNKEMLKTQFVRLELWAHYMQYLPPNDLGITTFNIMQEEYQKCIDNYTFHSAPIFDEIEVSIASLYAPALLRKLFPNPDNITEDLTVQACAIVTTTAFYELTQNLVTEYFKLYTGVSVDDEVVQNNMQEFYNDLENHVYSMPFFTLVDQPALQQTRQKMYGLKIDLTNNIHIAYYCLTEKKEITEISPIFRYLIGKDPETSRNRYNAQTYMSKLCTQSPNMQAVALTLQRDLPLLDVIHYLTERLYNYERLPLVVALNEIVNNKDKCEIALNIDRSIKLNTNFKYLAQDDQNISFKVADKGMKIVNPIWFFKNLFMMRALGKVSSFNLESLVFPNFPMNTEYYLQITTNHQAESHYKVELNYNDETDTLITKLCEDTNSTEISYTDNNELKFAPEYTIPKPSNLNKKYKDRLDDKAVDFYFKDPKLLYQKLNGLVLTDDIYTLCIDAEFKRNVTKLFHYMALNESYHVIVVLKYDNDQFVLKGLDDPVTDGVRVKDFITEAIKESNGSNDQNIDKLMITWLQYSYVVNKSLNITGEYPHAQIKVPIFVLKEVDKLNFKKNIQKRTPIPVVANSLEEKLIVEVPETIRKNFSLAEPQLPLKSVPELQSPESVVPIHVGPTSVVQPVTPVVQLVAAPQQPPDEQPELPAVDPIPVVPIPVVQTPVVQTPVVQTPVAAPQQSRHAKRHIDWA